MTTMYVDFEGGNDANDGLSFANRKQTASNALTAIGSGAHELRIMRSPAPTSMGQTATWTNASNTVTLSSAVTANIDTGDAAWTASANVTATASTATYREGTASANLVIATAFTTGLVAYKATGALNLSAYEQVSFLFRINTAVAAAALELHLCSDAAGVTAVHTMVLPATEAGVWTALVFNFGSALSSSIQSVALYAASDPGSRTVNIDNIVACKAQSAADCLTHQSLICDSSSDDDAWYAVSTINGTAVKLASGSHSLAGASSSIAFANWYGTTGSRTIYVRRALETTFTANVTVDGTSGAAPFRLTGGWDTTDMSTQPSATWLLPLSNSTTQISLIGGDNMIVDGFGFTYGRQLATGVLAITQSKNVVIDRIWMAACGLGSRVHQTDLGFTVLRGKSFTGCRVCFSAESTCGGDFVLNVEGLVAADGYFQSFFVDDASSYGVGVVVRGGTFKNLESIVGSSNSFGPSYARISDADAALSGGLVKSNGEAQIFFDNVRFNGTLPRLDVSGVVSVMRRDGVANSSDGLYLGASFGNATFFTATDQRHTASNHSWKITYVDLNQSEYRPLTVPVAKVACNASEARTVSLWMYRDGTEASGRLRVKQNAFNGIASTAYSDMAGSSGAWEEVTVTFTPTEDCVAEVVVESWTTNAARSIWIDDFSVS